jgi:HlyD family secretion protein
MKRALKPIGLVLVTAAIGACSPQADGDAEALTGPSYKEVVVERRQLRIAVTASGLVRPIDRIELKSKASGEVMELPIEVGDATSKGALVAKLDQVEERTALAQARADLDIAQAELELAEKNFERRKLARSEVVRANTGLERAQERMEDTVIQAPVDGIILQKYVEKGQIIASGVSNVGGGTPIADIADMRRVYVEAGVDEIDIGRIDVDQRATVHAEAFPDHVYEGSVVRIAPEARVEQNVTLFDVVVEVENSDTRLKSGMNASVEIVIVEEAAALLIPLAALQQDAADPGGSREGAAAPVVLVKDGDDFVPREIRTGRTDYRVIEVLGGIVEGDVLGIPMASRLKDEHERMEARIRKSRSFGGDRGRDKRPSGGRR